MKIADLDHPPVRIVESRWRVVTMTMSMFASGLALMAFLLIPGAKDAAIVMIALVGAGLTGLAILYGRKTTRRNIMVLSPQGIDFLGKGYFRERRDLIAWDDIDHFEVVELSRFSSMVGLLYAKHYVPKSDMEAGMLQTMGGLGALAGQWPGGSRATVALLNAAHARWAKVRPE